MMKKLFKQKDAWFYGALVTVVIGIFLRFYRFYDFVTFLGDQGRDAIVIKRIITFEHWPAIGAPMSVGHVFLGPFYYYFIAPWLALSRLDPAGLAFGVAVFSVLHLILTYIVLSKIFDKGLALFVTVLTAFSYAIIELSRFSWNPNTLPFFTLVFLSIFFEAMEKRKLLFFFLAGMAFGVMTQLHYLALIFGLPIAILFLTDWYHKKRSFLDVLKSGVSIFAGFVLISLPLIVFDLRHQFINSKALIKLFTASDAVGASKLDNLLGSCIDITRFAFSYTMSRSAAEIVLLGLFVWMLYSIKKYTKESFFVIMFVSVLFGISLYQGPRYIHYATSIYQMYYIIIGLILMGAVKISKLRNVIGCILIAIFIFLQYPHYQFLLLEPSKQINRARSIAGIIAKNVKVEKYQLTGMPDKYSDSMYRYFLEIGGKKPTEKDSPERGDELFVVCDSPCTIIGDPQWDIALFAPNKIVGTWMFENVRIYKLVR